MPGTEPVEADDAIYSERNSYELWLWVMILGLIALYIAVLIGALVKKQVWISVLFGVLAVALIALLVNFRRLEFSISGSEVEFGFGLIRKRFNRADIKSCVPCTLDFRNYYGYGIRAGRDGTIAYNTRNGPGIKLVVEGQKRPYVVSVSDPKRICELLSRTGAPD